MHDPHTQRRGHGCSGQPRLHVPGSGADLAVGDARLTELRALEQRVVRVQQALVAAPVDVERPLGLHRRLRLEIRVHVGAAEGVDRLLRIADEDERLAVGIEGAAHDVPLHGVGVLELVDQDDIEALTQAGTRQGASRRITEGVAQPEEDVVVGEDVQGPLARLHLLAHALGEAAARRFELVPVGQRRNHKGVGDVEDLAGDLARLLPREGDRVLPMGELAQVEVVDDLVDQVAHVLDQRHVAVDVARGAEPVEDLQAEPVRRLDRGGVEVGDRLAQPAAPQLLLGPRHVRQELHDVVTLGGLPPGQDIGQAVEGAHQPVPHPLAQLSRGHARERHDEETVDRQVVFRDVPGRQRGDREGLPGARARLQQRRSARQRTVDLERGHLLVPTAPRRQRRHWSRTLSRSNNPSQTRRA